MAFGQSSGPPATHTQMRRLTELLGEAGHTDFRDARGPLGLNQRQAGGKFTRDEAEALIEQLEAEADAARAADDTGEAEEPARAPRTPTAARTLPLAPTGARPSSGALARMPTELLAAELQQRGWIVIEP